jgi:hypothetical protein
VIFAFKSEETSVTDQTLLILPTDKLDFGLNKKNNANGKITPNNGFMNDVYEILFNSNLAFYVTAI